jgi:hypothetical protein
MFTYLNSIRGSADVVFLICAVTGMTLFVLRGLFMFLGDIFHDADVDHHHEDVAPTFKFLTLHTMTGFLMIFGLLGLGLRHQLDFPFGLTLGLALMAGIFMMLLVAVIFYAASHMASSGTQFSTKRAVGLPAVVYQRITASDDGKIQVVVQGVTRELNARSVSRAAIDSFVHVKIVGTVDQTTVLVEPLKD